MNIENKGGVTPVKKAMQGPSSRGKKVTRKSGVEAVGLAGADHRQQDPIRSMDDLRKRTVYSLEDAERSEEMHEFDYNEEWDEQKNLITPDPRPGFVQRWVRVSMHGETDVRNINRRMNQGFRARPASSATHLNSIMLGDDDVIGDEENILMERPAWMADRQNKAKRAAALKQMEEVHKNIYSATPGGGFGQISYVENSTMTNSGGRLAPSDI